MIPTSENFSDTILVSGLELSAHLGVPEEERLHPQRLTVNLEILPKHPLSELKDDLSNTVDYHELTRRVQSFCRMRPRKLIETLAEEICTLLLENYPIKKIKIELRKYILNDADFVAIRLHRPEIRSH